MRTKLVRQRCGPLGILVAFAVAAVGCRDATRFTTGGDHFEGAVLGGTFIRAGIAEDTRMCLTLDGERLQDNPGSITTSDGRLHSAALRPLPQLWHDPLSTLAFGEGRLQNLIYAVSPATADATDALAVVSLMESGSIEVRLLRGAPSAENAGAAVTPPLFGVFPLERRPGPCTL